MDAKLSEWKEIEDSKHQKYVYNTKTKASSWTSPDAYTNRRKYKAYLFVIERPLLTTMGNWRFHKI